MSATNPAHSIDNPLGPSMADFGAGAAAQPDLSDAPGSAGPAHRNGAPASSSSFATGHLSAAVSLVAEFLISHAREYE
jgi:hypothetical protein